MCACCGGTANAAVAVGSAIVQYKGNQKVTHYSTWPVPVCETCKEHHETLKRNRGADALFAIVATLSVAALIFVDAQQAKIAAGAMLLLAFIAWIWGHIRRVKPESLLGPNCSDLHFIGYTHKPESIAGHGRVHWFNFANREFAQRFAELNDGTLVSEGEFERDRERGYEDTVGVVLPRRDLHF